MRKIQIALDWTPNTNHSGFFMAQALGYYKERALEVSIRTPLEDNYATTPAKKVETGEVDLALCPFESVISYRTKNKAFDAVALAALLQEDLSAIVTLESSGITSPKALDRSTYASYKARYEDEIVRQVIKHDKGNGEITISYPDKLGIWETLLKGKADATWIFMNWEGVQAQAAGVALNVFRLADYGVPYGYSPVIMGSRSRIATDNTLYSDFLTATKKGFLYAAQNQQEAVKTLWPHVKDMDTVATLLASQEYTAPYYGTRKNWGSMREQNVENFLNWLYNKKLEPKQLRYKDVVMAL